MIEAKSVIALIIFLIVTIGIPLTIAYFLIKKAVKNGIIEALEEIKEEKDSEEE